MTKTGTLFIVATPIGNLDDITFRAVETLKNVDLIAAEDTRHSKTLLKNYNIKTKTISLHDYNEDRRTDLLLDKLKSGEDIALISDAGTPLISDPGNLLVKKAIDNDIKVVPIPGPCAAITALSASGLPTDKFVFEGFLPPKQKQQLDRLQTLADETRTIIFYEAPHRLISTIENMQNTFEKDRRIVIAKELTKKFEKIYSNKLSEAKNWLLENKDFLRGEFVILIEGTSKNQAINHETLRILNLLSENMSHKDAITLTSKITGVKKNNLYKFHINTTNLEKN